MNLVNFSWNFISIFLWKHAWTFLRLEFNLNLVSSSDVFYLHVTNMINIHTSYNNVVAKSHWSYNDKMIFIVFEFYVLSSKSLKLKFVSFKTLLHCCVHPKLILIRKSISSSDRRMVGNLFWDVFPSFSSHFKGLPKDRVKRFSHSEFSTSILWNWKSGNIRHS